jgi:subfamily B ATP-binding cassette protein MsbA
MGRSRPGRPGKEESFGVGAWREAQDLLLGAPQAPCGLGLALMLVSRLAGLVLPASSKWLIDEVVGKRRTELLRPIAWPRRAATLVQAATSFVLSQILGVAAQRAITDMRIASRPGVLHLPVRYFDSTQTGILVSRIMQDAEGIRNLVGSGLVQLVGGLVTAVMGLGVLFWLNWHLTTITILVLGVFGGGMAYALRTLRRAVPRARKINAEVDRPPDRALGGIRIVKSYTARSARRSSSPRARTGCFATSRSR